MLKTTLAAAVCVASCNCPAGELLRDATVIEVASSYGGADFAIKLSGGTGVCTGAAWIVLPESKA